MINYVSEIKMAQIFGFFETKVTCAHESHNVPPAVQARVLKTLTNIAHYKERIKLAKEAGRSTKSYQTLLDSAERGLKRIGQKYDISSLLPKPAGAALPDDVAATVNQVLSRIAEYEARIKAARKAGRSTKSYETLLASAKRNLTKIGRKYDLSDVAGIPKDVLGKVPLPPEKLEAAVALRNRIFTLQKDLEAARAAGRATASRQALLDAAKRSLERRFGQYDLSKLPAPKIADDPVEALLRKYDSVIRKSQGRNMFNLFSPEYDRAMRRSYEKLSNFVDQYRSKSLRRYISSEYKSINRALKGGRRLTDSLKGLLRDMQALAKPLTDNTPLVRGIDVRLNLKVGDTWSDAQFLSSSRSLSIANTFGKGTYNSGRTRANVGTLIEFVNTKGTKAIVTNIGELETVFLPGQKFRVLAVETDKVLKRGAVNTWKADRYVLMAPE